MGALKVWDGSTWQTVSQSGPEGTVWVGTDAPATADDGDLWYDTDDTSSMLTLPLTVADGGTGATNAATARTNLVTNGAGQSGSTAGAPTTGTWARGDTWLDSNNLLWVCTTGGTPGLWKSMGQGQELHYSEGPTAMTTVTATSAAAAQVIIAGASVTYDGSPIVIEAMIGAAAPPAAAGSYLMINLWDGSTDLGYLSYIQSPAASQLIVPTGVVERRLTPTAGAHTYSVRASVNAGSGQIYSTAGAPGSSLPISLRIVRAA